MEVTCERCCGLDIHKRSVVACLIVPGPGGAPTKTVRTFGTMTADLLELGDWLAQAGCAHVAMESTGVYWKPLYNLLEDQFSLLLVNAQAVTALTSERDQQTLELLLMTDVTAREFIFGKLGGVFYNAKEAILIPLLLAAWHMVRGEMSVENFIYVAVSYAVLVTFAAMLGLHAGLSFENALQEIAAKWDNELSREFTRVLRDIGMGISRRLALLGLSERTGVQDIVSFVASLNQAEELAARFEDHEPDAEAIRDATALRELRQAFLARAEAEQRVLEAVKKARADRHSWASIGSMLGTSGEAARQRHGQRTSRS